MALSFSSPVLFKRNPENGPMQEILLPLQLLGSADFFLSLFFFPLCFFLQFLNRREEGKWGDCIPRLTICSVHNNNKILSHNCEVMITPTPKCWPYGGHFTKQKTIDWRAKIKRVKEKKKGK